MALTVRVPAPVAAGASLRRCPPVHSLMRPQLQRHIATAATHQITFRFPSGEEQVVACDSERYLLDAGLDANVDLPSCCSSGTCTACTGRIVQGEIDASDQVYLNEDQLALGFALLCTSRPRSDCVVLTHQEETLHITST